MAGDGFDVDQQRDSDDSGMGWRWVHRNMVRVRGREDESSWAQEAAEERGRKDPTVRGGLTFFRFAVDVASGVCRERAKGTGDRAEELTSCCVGYDRQ